MALCVTAAQWVLVSTFRPTVVKSSKYTVASASCLSSKRQLLCGNAHILQARSCRSVCVPHKIRVAASSEDFAATHVGNCSKETVPDSELSITKTSFGTIGLTVGVFLLAFGFGAYFNLLPGSDFSALMLTYGFPLTLIGFALKYAELKPVPCVSYKDAVALRDVQATEILIQVRSDVTRYRYGDEQHLEEALKRIFRYNQAGGISRRAAPTLQSVSEEIYDGRYSLALQFYAPSLQLEDFISREAKFTSFFGPGVTAFVGCVGPQKFQVRLVSDGGKELST